MPKLSTAQVVDLITVALKHLVKKEPQPLRPGQKPPPPPPHWELKQTVQRGSKDPGTLVFDFHFESVDGEHRSFEGIAYDLHNPVFNSTCTQVIDYISQPIREKAASLEKEKVPEPV
jgi:hypothetical protein